MRLSTTLALALSVGFTAAAATASAEALPPIKQVVFFGDSLTDAGTFWFRFTTDPGLSWAQHVALAYGQSPLPNQHIDSYDDVYKGNHGLDGPGGLNYAEGGAKTNSAYSQTSQDPEGKPISAVVQVRHYLQQHQGFAADQLVTLYVGTNDVAWDYDSGNSADIAKTLRDDKAVSSEVMAKETARVEQAAQDEADLARTILAHGAKRLVVFTLPDMANLPWFQTEASQGFVHNLANVFNRRLETSLPHDPAILVLHTEPFFDDLFANAGRYGFTHLAHEDACHEADQDFCYPNAWKEPTADQTYVFAAGEHMTTHANTLFAQYVLDAVKASPLR